MVFVSYGLGSSTCIYNVHRLVENYSTAPLLPRRPSYATLLARHRPTQYTAVPNQDTPTVSGQVLVEANPCQATESWQAA